MVSLLTENGSDPALHMKTPRPLRKSAAEERKQEAKQETKRASKRHKRKEKEAEEE